MYEGNWKKELEYVCNIFQFVLKLSSGQGFPGWTDRNLFLQNYNELISEYKVEDALWCDWGGLSLPSCTVKVKNMLMWIVLNECGYMLFCNDVEKFHKGLHKWR